MPGRSPLRPSRAIGGSRRGTHRGTGSGRGVPGRDGDVSTIQGPPGIHRVLDDGRVDCSGLSASRRTSSFGQSGGADRTQSRSRSVRADRTRFQGTSPVHDGGWVGDKRTQCRGGHPGHDGGSGADRIPHRGVRVGGVARCAAAGSGWATVAAPRRGPQAGLPGGRSNCADRSQFRGASLFRACGSVRTDRTLSAGALAGRA